MKRALLVFLTLVVASMACSMPVPNSVPTQTALPTPKKSALAKPPNALGTPVLTAEVIAYQSLHVRNEPLGTVLGYLYHGDPVTLTNKCSDGWAQIEWEDGAAWVNADYLSENICSEEE